MIKKLPPAQDFSIIIPVDALKPISGIQVKVVLVNKRLTGFNVVLLGLDGGEKFNSNNVEKANVFFNLIDKMPMRRQELRNKRND